MSKRVSVSIDKLDEFLSRKSYTIIGLYVCGDSIRFVEAQTYKYQRNFMIYISKKYKMDPRGSSFPKIPISGVSSTKLVDVDRQVAYLKNIKGNVECDLTSVSSRFICVHRTHGPTEIYTMGSAALSGIDDTIKTEISPIVKESRAQKIVAQAERVFKTIKEPLVLDDLGEDDDLVDDEDEVELEFEDEDGESVDAVSEFIEPPPFITAGGGNPTQQSIKSTASSSRVVPIKLEDEDIILGITYHIIDLLVFYKSIDDLDEKIFYIYGLIDDNENHTRRDRVMAIENLAHALVSKMHTAREKYHSDEKEMRNQINKLSRIFDQTAGLKGKIKGDLKYADSTGEVERVYNQTRILIHDINIELLRLRDAFDELLDNTHDIMDEIIKL